jgi:hypothetical protein
MTSFYSEVVPFIWIHLLFWEPSIQNPFEISAYFTFQNESRSNTARNSLPPFNRILPPYNSVFDQLLQRYGNEWVEGHGEFDYIAVTAYSPLHQGVGQQTPTRIIIHLGVEEEGKVPKCVKLEPDTTIWLYDWGWMRGTLDLKGCGYLGKLRRFIVRNWVTISIDSHPTYLWSQRIPFQSAFQLLLLRFPVIFFQRAITLIDFMRGH